MSSEVGSGHISIFPVLTGFKSRVTKETKDAGAAGAKTFEGGFKGAGSAAGRTLGRDLKSALSANAGDLGAAETKKLTGEIASASAALAKVRLRQQDEAGKVRIAETRLQEAITRSGAASSQAVAAEERLSSARRAHATTTDSITAASQRLRNSQDALRTATEGAGDGATRAGGRFAGFASAAGSGISSVVGMAGRAGAAIGDALSSGFRAAQNASAVAVAAIGAKVLSLVPSAVRASDAVDKFKSTLNFAGLDASRIDELTASTQKYADTTVYELADIQSVTAQLAANSVKDFDRLAEAGGNLNAVAGGNADTFKSVGMVLTQTAGAGKLTTENWNQLANAIPGASGKLQTALAAAGAYTGNFREAMEKGEISAEEFNAAILELGLTDAAKQAATSTKTIEGAIGSLNASITGGLVKVIEPLKPLITGALTGAAGAFTSFFDRVSLAVTGIVSLLGSGDFTAAFGQAFGVAEDSPVVGFLLGVRDAVSGFASVIPNLLTVLGPMVAVLGAGGLSGVLASLGPLGALLPGLGSALSIIGGPIGIVAAGLAGLAFSGGNIGDLVVGLTSVVDSVVGALPGMVATVAGVVPQIVAGILEQVPRLLATGAEIVTVLVNGLVVAIPAIASGALSLVQGLLNAIVANLPMIIEAAIMLVTSLIQGIVTAIPLLITAALQLVSGLLTAIVAALPMIIEGGIQLLLALVLGLVGALPDLLEAALGLVMGLLGAIIENLPMIIEAGIQLLLSLVTGLIGALPQLITAAINLVLQLVIGLLTMLPQLIEAGITLVVSLITGLVQAIPQIIEMMPQIVKAIWDGLAGVNWLDLGAQIIKGIIDGLFSMIGSVGDAVGSVVETITDFFPHSPAKRGPLSGAGWSRLKSSGAATIGQFNAGANAESSNFGDSLVDMAAAASRKAQAAMSNVSATVEASATGSGAPGAPGPGSGAPGAGAVGTGFTQINNFAEMDPEPAIEAANQRASAALERAGV